MMFETFSQRKKKLLRSGDPDVYTYDELPTQLRHQLCMTMHEGIGDFHRYGEFSYQSVPCANDMWEEIDKICRKEIYSYLGFCGTEYLNKRYFDYLMRATDQDDLLSAIEIGCVGLAVISGRPSERGAEVSGADAIKEVNERFLQHSIGYRFENRNLIKIDSEYIHSEIVKPALKILSEHEFAATNLEFMVAHKHYRNGEFKGAVTAANRAFETMLKNICDKNGWQYKKGDRASELVTIVTSRRALPFDKAFSAYVAMLKAGLPGIRNDAGAHGQGSDTVAVTGSIAQFAINMTAANITFLAQALSSPNAK